MLVLSRKLHEEIVIGESIIVRVADVQGGKVKLGITAPFDVPIMRRELLDRDGQPEASDDPVDRS